MNDPEKNENAFEVIADFLLQDRHGPEGLTAADRRLAIIGCLAAVGPDSPELGTTLREAISSGVSPKSIEAMLIHAIGYLGIITVRRAHEQLISILAEANLAGALDGATTIAPERSVRIEQGVHLYDRFDPGRQAKQAARFATLSAIYYPRAMELSGLVLADPALPLRDRQIMTIAMLSSYGGQPDQLLFHIGVALRNEVSHAVLAGVLIIVQAYAGMPRANSAATLALEAMALYPDSGKR
jgi:4-carboxymuconolactone decarboxylase